MKTSVQIRVIFDNLFDLWLSFLLCGLGLVTNTKSIAVFRKQGLQESATISLAVISGLDLLKCAIGFVHRIYGLLQGFDAALAENWLRTTYMLNINFQNITAALVNVITMYVTFERCLCVCVPFKIKVIITRAVTYKAIAFFTTAVLATMIPPAMTYTIAWEFDSALNQTLAQYALTNIFQDAQTVYDYTTFINIFWHAATFSIIVICTIVISYRLQHFSKFRSGNASVYNSSSYTNTQTDNSDQKFFPAGISSQKPRKNKLSSRDAQLVKMLLLLVVMYFINIVPRLVIAVYRDFEPEFYVNRCYHDLYMTVVDVMVAVEFVNSSTNFFIYLVMSSHFRSVYLQMFRIPLRN